MNIIPIFIITIYGFCGLLALTMGFLFIRELFKDKSK